MKSPKRLFSILSLLAFATMAWAQSSSQQRLVVWLKGGDKVYYQIDEVPVTTFQGQQLVIKCNNQAAVYYQRDNVLRYTFEGLVNGIDLLPNEHSVSVNRESDAVTFENLPEGTAVQVYNVGGVLLETLNAVERQPLTVSISQRPRGMYIIKAGSQTIKLSRP
jgi:hypothetical protein